MAKILSTIERMQRQSLFGYTYGNETTPNNEYMGFGAVMSAYDLNTPGAIAEIKRAMVALAQLSNPFGGAADPVIETTWKLITDDDIWDEAAGEEFLLAMSRYRNASGLNWPHIAEPYVQPGLEGSLPQPTVSGLELLAGAAVNLAPSARMKLYEQWRSTGCTLCIKPPSNVSMPGKATPVLLTVNVGSRLAVPPQAPQDLAAVAAGFDADLQTMWNVALASPSEALRASNATVMRVIQKSRDDAAMAAINATPIRQGVTTVTTPVVPEPQQAGMGIGTVLLVGAVAVGVYYVATKKKGR